MSNGLFSTNIIIRDTTKTLLQLEMLHHWFLGFEASVLLSGNVEVCKNIAPLRSGDSAVTDIIVQIRETMMVNNIHEHKG